MSYLRHSTKKEKGKKGKVKDEGDQKKLTYNTKVKTESLFLL